MNMCLTMTLMCMTITLTTCPVGETLIGALRAPTQVDWEWFLGGIFPYQIPCYTNFMLSWFKVGLGWAVR